MNKKEYYMNLPHDLSGSRSKNRFRLELLWGVSRMLELMESAENFTIIFDYVCDIEIHLDEGFEFYQIKTEKEAGNGYTLKRILNQKKGDQGSILGKLYVLHNEEMPVKLALACNKAFKALSSDPGEISFVQLNDEKTSEIINALKNELDISDVDLNDLYYIYTPMNLVNPEYEIKGQLITTFEKIKKSEPNYPNALYRLVMEEVSEKACYEFDEKDYEKIQELKGISRTKFNEILDMYSLTAKNGIKETNDYINNINELGKRKKYKDALSSLLPKLSQLKILQDLENSIVQKLKNKGENLGEIDDEINWLSSIFDKKIPIEYTVEEKKVFYMIVIYKYLEGAYDNENVV